MVTYTLDEDTIADCEDNLEAFCELIARSEINRLYTSMIARVEELNAEEGWCDLQPVIRMRYISYEDGVQVIVHPMLLRVPIGREIGGGMSVVLPLERGDFVLVSFCDRSIAEWKMQGGRDVTPRMKARYHAMDAVIVKQVRPFNAPLMNVEEGALLLGEDRYVGGGNEDAEAKPALKRLRVDGEKIELAWDHESEPKRYVRVTEAGKIAIGDDTNELLDIIDQLITAMGTAAAPSGGGPVTYTPLTILTDIQAKLATLKQ